MNRFKQGPIEFLGIVLLSTLAGCASLGSVIPKDLKAGVSPELSFREVSQNPSGAIGKTVLWGGTLIEVVPHGEGTRLEILQKPLGYRDRPVGTDESEGRFFVERPSLFLDPAVYEKGREVTIVGEITEERKEMIGELEYRYPVVLASYVHLWKKRPSYAREDIYFYPPSCWYGYRPYAYDLYPDPYCFRGPHWPIVYPFRIVPAHTHREAQ